jgi:hypothetical protein
MGRGVTQFCQLIDHSALFSTERLFEPFRIRTRTLTSVSMEGNNYAAGGDISWPWTTTTDTNSDNQATSNTLWIAVAIIVGYPLLMIILVLGCKKFMFLYGPYAGLSYEEVTQFTTVHIGLCTFPSAAFRPIRLQRVRDCVYDGSKTILTFTFLHISLATFTYQ